MKITDTGVRFEFDGRKGVFNYVQLDKRQFRIMEISRRVLWCWERWGEPDPKEGTWWYNAKQFRFFFTNRNNMLLFVLRWS